MKSNFKTSNSETPSDSNSLTETENTNKELTKEEFEEYMLKSGASGSFMVYRSDKKDDELGMDEL
jgi:hypothetical protein